MGDREEAGSRQIEARKPVVLFKDSMTMSTGYFGKHRLLQVITLRKAEVEQKFFLDYGEDFLV